jgi:Flp pilus assembly protein TadG
MIARISALWRDQRGNSMVEMALVTPLLATLLIGTVDISRAVSTKIVVEQAAQSAVEEVQAQANFDTDNAGNYEADAEAAAGDGSSASLDAWLECDNDGVHLDFDTGTCDTGVPYARYVQVNVSKTFSPMFGTQFFPGATADGVPVSGKAVVRVQ